MIVPDWAGYLRFRSRLAEALDPAFYPIEYLDTLILSGAARLFLSQHAAMVAELKQYPGGARAVHCLVAAGRIEDMTDALRPRIEAWGRGEGCSRAIVESRAAWARVLKPFGYGVHQVSVIKEL